MKKLVFIGMIFVALTGCQSGKIEVREEKQNDNTEMWEISVTKSLFSSENAGYAEQCKTVNQRLTVLVDSLIKDFKTQVIDYNKAFDTIPDGQPFRPLEMFVEDSVFSANTNYISLRLKVYASLGGANGETSFYAINYDLDKKQFLSIGEILNLKQAESINKLLKDNFVNPDHCFSDLPTVANCSALNFTDRNLCFMYGKYVLGAGACGDVAVDIERSELKNLLLIK